MNWFMLAITVFVFVFSTADVVIAITLQATFDGLDGGKVITKRLIISSLVVETATYITTDAVLILRCWLVYQKSWRVVCYPLILWLGNVACMILWASTFIISLRRNAASYDFLSMLALQIFYTSNFAMNLYATSAIVYRVWRVARANNHRSSILHRVYRIVAGTGILYTCTSLPLVVTAFLMAKNVTAYIICGGINFSVAGITFNLLLIRVGQLRADVDMEVCEGTCDMTGTIILSTVQFNLPTVATDECTLDSVNLHQRDRTDAHHQEKAEASS